MQAGLRIHEHVGMEQVGIAHVAMILTMIRGNTYGHPCSTRSMMLPDGRFVRSERKHPYKAVLPGQEPNQPT